MVEIKKILAPTDFSEYSKLALRYAAAMAKSFRATLYVVHVKEELPYQGGVEGYLDLETTEKTDLMKITSELRSQAVEVEPVFLEGRPYIQIIEKAKSLDVDLIVLATHGRRGLSHLVFGSVAEKVVRLAPCPVLTIKNPDYDSTD